MDNEIFWLVASYEKATNKLIVENYNPAEMREMLGGLFCNQKTGVYENSRCVITWKKMTIDIKKTMSIDVNIVIG